MTTPRIYRHRLRRPLLSVAAVGAGLALATPAGAADVGTGLPPGPAAARAAVPAQTAAGWAAGTDPDHIG
ncbi:hypothetical protein ABZ281_32945, partial [Streptomyces sp. NPDC006265]